MTAAYGYYDENTRLCFYADLCRPAVDVQLPDDCGHGDACEGAHDPEEDE